MADLLNKIHHADCMGIMADMADKSVDLAIVDPPYGIGSDNETSAAAFKSQKWKSAKLKGYKSKNWDKKPNKEYFDELFRVSKHQIIWGGNYFIDNLNPTSSFIVWDKLTGNNTFSDCELAWSSHRTSIRKFTWLWNGFQKQKPETRVHPTQKPVALYRWLLQNYAKSGNLILDTHSGSGSCAIACHLEGFDFIAIEKDKDYFAASVKRLETERSQLRMFG